MTATITGIHHVKIPVTDLTRSRVWYERVFGFRANLEFPDEDGTVRGVAGEIGGVGVGLRENAAAAAGTTGFDPVCFAIADRSAAEDWVAHLAAVGAEHSEIGRASDGWVVRVHDPDGIEIRLYSTAPDDDHAPPES